MPEYAVCHVEDLDNGEMKQVTAGETDVLLIRMHNTYAAVHAYCTHYGAPLEGGVLSDDRIVCPWHHACFHAGSGQQLEPPGLDSIPRYEVRIEDGNLVVVLPDDPAQAQTPPVTKRAANDERTVAVIGAGAAGAYAVEALREEGFTGRVVLISREDEVPYDRPNCSKAYLHGEAPDEWMSLRSRSFYEERDVDLLLGRVVASVDAPEKRVTFADGATLDYDAAILCTGGTPRTLDVPGADLDGVHTLRSYADSRHLLQRGREAQRVVVVGASFIGMEAAWSFRELGAEVAVVAPEEVPFEAVFGAEVGTAIQSLHEREGVSFHLGTTVARFRGAETVQFVELDDGETLEADLVLVGVGVRPATDMVEGVALAEDGSVEVDDTFSAGNGLYAAGDVATFPYWRTGEPTRIEHWRVACQQGRIAGYNVAGRDVVYRSIPFFWTAHFGTSIRYVGHASSWDEVILDGSPDALDFIAYYVRRGAVQAACGAGRDREMAAIEELMRRDRMPAPVDLYDGDVDLLALL